MTVRDMSGPYASLLRFGRRLRATPLSFLAFTMAGCIAHLLWTMPGWMRFMNAVGIQLGIYRFIVPDVMTSLLVTLILRASVDTGSDMTDRPGRFLRLVAFAITLSTLLTWAFEVAVGMVLPYSPGYAILARWLINIWLNGFLFAALFGWLAFLHLGRVEQDRQLSALMMRNSLLTRQVAHSRLVTTRAKIDPQVVTRVLRELRTRYRSDDAAATRMLDHLISYLRLALNRAPDGAASHAAALALLRAYVELRSIEMNVHIETRMPEFHAVMARHAWPWFSVARAMLEAVLHTAAARMRLSIEHEGDGLTISVGSDGIPHASETILKHMRMELTALATELHGISIELKEPAVPGGGAYVARLTAH